MAERWPFTSFGEAGGIQLWLCSARPIRADQSQVPRAGSAEQERRGAPLIARNTTEVSPSIVDPNCFANSTWRSFTRCHNSSSELVAVFAAAGDEGAAVSFMQYDLGYFDLEQKTPQPLDNPFGTRLSLMS
jgi:hypothetical protein